MLNIRTVSNKNYNTIKIHNMMEKITASVLRGKKWDLRPRCEKHRFMAVSDPHVT